MRYQIDGQQLRLRLDRDELATLLGTGQLRSVTHFPAGFSQQVDLALHDAGDARLEGLPAHWKLALPRREMADLAARLPCREGVIFQLSGAEASAVRMQLTLDVDIRDRRRD